MSVYFESYCRPLCKHNRGCKKSNEVHERRRAELHAIHTSFHSGEIEDLVAMEMHLLLAIDELQQTKLWKRFTTNEEISFECITLPKSTCDPQMCEGCYQTLVFYAKGHIMMLQSFAEVFVAESLKGDSVYRNRCWESVGYIYKELNTAHNISKHAEALSRE